MRPSTTRRTALAILVAVLAAPPALALSPEDRALVAKAVAYLDGLSAVKAKFSQTDARGDLATGVLYLARPGRARFQYDPPTLLLITCDGTTVTVTDSRLKTQQRFPLKETPLAVFLADHIRLDRGARVTRVDRTGSAFSITARSTNAMTGGEITLYFEDAPIRLTGWVVVDAQARMTRVILEDLTPISAPSDDLFVQAPLSHVQGQM
ncbi:MAG TPA: outer-membrane lipoprotein carrier protein LolA [Caulobacteraceae bacterium]|nr:outer-membrane lipoprotein carrier protein LolA [Caulobacteraceae bacterium]